MFGGADLTPGMSLLWPMVGGIDPTLSRIPLGSKSKVGTLIDLVNGENSYIFPYPPRQSRLVEQQGDSPGRSPTPVDVGGVADQERCIPILWRTGIRPEVAGIQQTDILMAVGV